MVRRWGRSPAGQDDLVGGYRGAGQEGVAGRVRVETRVGEGDHLTAQQAHLRAQTADLHEQVGGGLRVRAQDFEPWRVDPIHRFCLALQDHHWLIMEGEQPGPETGGLTMTVRPCGNLVTGFHAWSLV